MAEPVFLLTAVTPVPRQPCCEHSNHPGDDLEMSDEWMDELMDLANEHS